MDKLHSNKFLKGIQQDVDRALSSNESYIDAENLTLSRDGNYFALKNVKGTVEIATLPVSTTGQVLAAFNCKFKNGTSTFKAILIFVKDGTDLKIFARDLTNNVTYTLFTETTYTLSQAVELDGFLYSEGGIDIVYFTDGVNEIRKLRCELSSPFVAFTPEQLTVLRKSPACIVTNTNYLVGGSLLCGSYQFAIRLVKRNTNTYTKWSLPTQPLPLFNEGTPSTALLGQIANRYFEITVRTTNEDFAKYDAFQVAVIKNVTSVEPTNADLLPIQNLTLAFSSAGYSNFIFSYKEDTKISQIPLSDIYVDLAPIKNLKTISFKNNRLLGANVEYQDLEYDNGTPSVTGSVTTTDIAGTDYYKASSYVNKGYFRDEVYRFYVVYFDKDYNFGTPQRLNMSSITGNQITNGDIRFPKRSNSTYAIFNAAGNGFKRLGLNLTLQNHPSWARGFYIFRAKRKKRIIFQSPYIPAVKIDGVDLVGEYPNQINEENGSGGVNFNVDVTNPSPMNPLGTIMPKNLFKVLPRNYEKAKVDNTANYTQKGELFSNASQTVKTADNDRYGFLYGSDYEPVNGDKIVTVDSAWVRLRGFSSENPKSAFGSLGNTDSTRAYGTFSAIGSTDYFYSNTSNRVHPYIRTSTVKGSKAIDNFGEGTTLDGQFICNFENLQTGGIPLNPKPNNQKSIAVKLNDARPDIAYFSQVAGFTDNLGGTISNSLIEDLGSEQTNEFNTASGTRLNIVDIVNVENNQGDDRYGEEKAQLDLVFTGASYLFTSGELAVVQAKGVLPININVAGGDCTITLHQYKVTDNHYGLVNIEKTRGVLTDTEARQANAWTQFYHNKYDDGSTSNRGIIGEPRAYNGVDTIIGVILESEDIGFQYIFPYSGNSLFNFFYQTNPATINEIGTAFDYTKNPGLSKEADDKVFILNPEESTSIFKSRIVYSDLKNYNTFIDGFDIIRSANFLDLEEGLGSINKIINHKDNVYAFQDNAVSLIPVDASTISTADAQTLSIRSGTVLDTPIYISRQLGTKYLYSVLSIDSGIFFTDTFNKKIGKVTGEGIDLISEGGVSSLFNNLLDGTFFRCFYDYQNFDLWHLSSEARVYDDRLGVWVSKFTLPVSTLGIYNDDGLYLIEYQGSNCKLHKMYEGDYNRILGVTVQPLVKVNINPDYNASKTFDNIILYSTAALSSADFLVKSENADQVANNLSVDVDYRRGYYQIPTLRAANDARLRGTRMEMTLKWKTTNVLQQLSEVITKYRISSRAI